jgi:hypothetical protein
VVRRRLLDRRRSVLIWGRSLGSFSGFMAAIYPSIENSIDQMVKNHPAVFKEGSMSGQ